MRVTFEKLAAKGVGGELLGGELGVAKEPDRNCITNTPSPGPPIRHPLPAITPHFAASEKIGLEFLGPWPAGAV